jgi:hypothetical protein
MFVTRLLDLRGSLNRQVLKPKELLRVCGVERECHRRRGCRSKRKVEAAGQILANQDKDFVVGLDESAVMSIAEVADAESPSVGRGETLASSSGCTREPKGAHNDGDRQLNSLNQRYGLAEAFVDPSVESVVRCTVVCWKFGIDGDEPIYSGTCRSVVQGFEEFVLV